MGRPAKPKDEKQSRVVAVRLTPGEYRLVKQAAAAIKPKASLSKYLRDKGLQPTQETA